MGALEPAGGAIVVFVEVGDAVGEAVCYADGFALLGF